MPNIDLCEKTEEYFSGGGKISVKKDNYDHCNIFHKITHQIKYDLTAENIYVFNYGTNTKGSVVLEFDWKTNSSYKLTSGEVYFNKYENTTPLIITLQFSNNIKMLYKLSNFKTDIKHPKNISGLNNYLNNKDLLYYLTEENDKLNNFLTFNLTQTSTYCNSKIDVEEDSNNIPLREQNSFKRYKHKPQSNYNSKQSCVMNGENEMLGKAYNKNSSSIGDIQNKNITCVYVYLSTKFNTPLFAEFIKNNNVNNPEYYCFYKDNDNSFYSEKLDGATLVKYIGTKQGESVNSETINNHSNVLRILKKLESYMFQTMIVMIDQNKEYGKNDVASFPDFSKCRLLNSDTIKTTVKSKDSNHCIGNTEYKLLEHDISRSLYNKQDVRIKLIIHTQAVNILTELTLYKGINTEPENIDSLDYPTTNRWENKVYVYFYGTDPRPLLVVYNGNGYKPKDLESYYSDWVRADGVGDCEYYGYNPKLVKTLSEVVGFLNQVNIYKNHLYEVHKYNNNKININVNTYYHNYCFHKHVHTPKSGYPLGNIIYDDDKGTKGTIIPYNTNSHDYEDLNSVSCFYFTGDGERKYPLLVEIKFTTNTYYYKLISNNDNKLLWINENDKNLISKVSNNNDHIAWYLNDIFNKFKEKGNVNRHISCGHSHSIEEKNNVATSRIMHSENSRINQSHTESASQRGVFTQQHNYERSQGQGNLRVMPHGQHYEKFYNRYPRHVIPEPQETGVQKATRIASTVGTFALAGTGVGVAIYKYSQWFIALFRRLF